MRKLVASSLSCVLFAFVLGGCATMTPNSVWSPRTLGESTTAPVQTPPR